MQANNMKFVLDQATGQHGHHKGDDRKFAKAAAEAIEVGILVPSIFRANLEAAGYKVVEDETSLKSYGFAVMGTLKRTLVTDKDGTIVAMGAAGDHKEALAHAALGWFREHARPESEVPEGLPITPTLNA